jgi:hypothetical protein
MTAPNEAAHWFLVVSSLTVDWPRASAAFRAFNEDVEKTRIRALRQSRARRPAAFRDSGTMAQNYKKIHRIREFPDSRLDRIMIYRKHSLVPINPMNPIYINNLEQIHMVVRSPFPFVAIPTNHDLL